jgi:hypothetical protein
VATLARDRSLTSSSRGMSSERPTGRLQATQSTTRSPAINRRPGPVVGRALCRSVRGAASSPAGHARAAGKRPGGKLASRTGVSTLVRGRLAAGRRNRRSVSCGVWPGVTHYGGHGSSGVEIRRGVFGGGCAGPPPFSPQPCLQRPRAPTARPDGVISGWRAGLSSLPVQFGW